MVYSQQVNKYPVEYGQFVQTNLLNNPANISNDSNIFFQTGILQHTGAFKSIRTIYGLASFKIKKNNLHNFGLQFISNKEGEYISKNYFYGRYSIKIPLNTHYQLSLGTSFGFVNYAFSGSSPYSSGADTKADANLGLYLCNKKYNLGYSINQIMNSSLKPIEETFTLSPYSTINADYTYNLNYNVYLKANLIAHLYSFSTINNNWALIVNHYNKVNWGAGFQSNRGLNYYFGIDKIPIQNDYLNFMFSYFTPVFDNPFNRFNLYELSVSYQFN